MVYVLSPFFQVPSVEEFCPSECSEPVARAYHCCSSAGGELNSTTRFGQLTNAGFGEIIQKGMKTFLFTHNKRLG